MIFAAASIAVIASAIAAPVAAGEQVYYTITFQEGRLGASQAGEQQSVAKVDSFTVKQGVKPYVHYKLDRVYVKSWSTSGDADAPPVGTSSLTMKRGTSPIGPTGPHDIRRLIIVTNATGGCRAGALYAAATMDGGGKSYSFTDVRITGCEAAGPEERITFVYGKVVVRGWDPKKKEE
jgi:hypothetical protein